MKHFFAVIIILLSLHKVMNLIKQKNIAQRNITPNFIRFRRNNSGKQGKSNSNKPTTPEDIKGEQTQQTDRSSSKVSRCSFQVYEKRILNLSRLKANLNLKKKNEETVVDPLKKNLANLNHKRLNSNEKQEIQRQNFVIHTHRKTEKSLSRKKNGSSGKIVHPYSKGKYESPKRTQDSLQKEQHNAKMMKTQLMNNLMTYNNGPDYMTKLRVKKREIMDKKKTSKKNILNCQIELKSEEAIKFYQIYGELGKGAYGTVRMGIDRRTGEKIAIKVYEKKRLDEVNKIKNLERQINILTSLNHPIIARLIEAIETPSEIYLIQEYGGANSLYNYLLSKPEHRLEQKEAKKFLKVIAQTLEHLHDKNIVHRDIKAENILINRHRDLKLIDFGFSLQSVPPATIDTFCGTPTYMAPEIVSKKDHIPVYTDMWSLGILFYVMLEGNYPFRAKNENQLFEKIRKGQFEYIHSESSEKSKRLIESLLRVNPYERLTIKEVLGKEYYEWLSQ